MLTDLQNVFNRPLEEMGLFDRDNEVYHISFNYRMKSKFKDTFNWNLGTERLSYHKYSGRIIRISIDDDNFCPDIEHLKKIYEKSVKLINVFINNHEFAKYSDNYIMILQSFNYRIKNLTGEVDG